MCNEKLKYRIIQMLLAIFGSVFFLCACAGKTENGKESAEVSTSERVFSEKSDQAKDFDDTSKDESEGRGKKSNADASAKDKAVEESEGKGSKEEDAKDDSLRSMTDGQANALRKANEYLKFDAFSYKGLKEQLIYNGFSEEDAEFAAERGGADWNEQAALKAQSYLEFMSFSRQGLIDQLLFEGFTYEQAEYGVSAVGY